MRVIAFLSTTIGLCGCLGPPYPNGSIEQLFPSPPRPQIISTDSPGHHLSAAVMPGPSGLVIVFVHGSPGDWKAWARFLVDPTLRGLGTLMAVDRPGFGESEPSRVVADLEEQASRIATLFPADSRVLIVGHSLGGPIALWMAIDHPAQVCGVVSVAGSFASEYESPRWYNAVAGSRLAAFLLPKPLLWSNREMESLPEQLKKLDLALPRLRTPVIAIQGAEDELVDPRTIQHLAARVDPALFSSRILKGAGHLIPWQHPEAVTAAIVSKAPACL